MRLLRTALIVLAAGAAATALSPAAEACFCGEVHGPVVARGVSAYGVPWHVRAQRDRPGAMRADFSIDPPGYPDAGFGVGLPLPAPARFTFTAVPGSGLDPFPEGDLSGVAARRVVTLVVRMSKGPDLRIRPRLAPRRLRARFAWLRDLRFFDQFFAGDREPVEVIAFDGTGHVIARRHSDRGLFLRDARG